jgi:hypothetical protein
MKTGYTLTIAAAIVLVIWGFYLVACQDSSRREKFTKTETVLAQKLSSFFQQPAHTYDGYLEVLTSGDNQSDKLISYDVYLALRKKPFVTVGDVALYVK